MVCMIQSNLHLTVFDRIRVTCSFPWGRLGWVWEREGAEVHWQKGTSYNHNTSQGISKKEVPSTHFLLKKCHSIILRLSRAFKILQANRLKQWYFSECFTEKYHWYITDVSCRFAPPEIPPRRGEWNPTLGGSVPHGVGGFQVVQNGMIHLWYINDTFM